MIVQFKWSISVFSRWADLITFYNEMFYIHSVVQVLKAVEPLLFSKWNLDDSLWQTKSIGDYFSKTNLNSNASSVKPAHSHWVNKTILAEMWLNVVDWNILVQFWTSIWNISRISAIQIYLALTYISRIFFSLLQSHENLL